MKFRILQIFLFLFIGSGQLFAQPDSVTVVSDTVRAVYKPKRIFVDSATLVRNKFVKDSITWHFVKPNPKRENLFVNAMLEKYIVKDITKLRFNKGVRHVENYGAGKPLKRFSGWILFVLLGLVISFGSLRMAFGKQMAIVFQAFYDDRALIQINKEENIFSSWYFLFSYVLFSLFIGLFLYILFLNLGIRFNLEGFGLFLAISFFFALFMGVKILVIRFIGFFFQFQRITRDYVNSIYLSFFNLSLLFIPLVICLALTVFEESSWILVGGLILIVIAFVLQFFRVSVHILRSYKVSKFYLILYLCTLEICPVIVIVKALNI